MPDRSLKLYRKVTFKLDDESWGLLVHIARTEGFTVSSIVRHLVKRYLAEVKRFGLKGKR